MGGNFVTKQRALVDFKFPELDNNKKITWICHVDERTDPTKAMYDIIIGMDQMMELGLFINTDSKEMCWKDRTAPLARRGNYQTRERLEKAYHMVINDSVLEAEKRQARILDADYSQVDTEEIECSARP